MVQSFPLEYRAFTLQETYMYLKQKKKLNIFRENQSSILKDPSQP